jgi:hypothetical protein
MRIRPILLLLFFLSGLSPLPATNPEITLPHPLSYYTRQGISATMLKQAFTGYLKLAKAGLIRREVLTLIDFTRPSSEKRLYRIDMCSGAVELCTWVAHGKMSGEEYASSFSNQINSLQSSLGFFITGNTYIGEHGLSLRLKGMDPGINDRAEDRAIVLHGANYVSESFIQTHGRLGRSHGCPAVAPEIHRELIESIRDGSCLFIYSTKDDYQRQSRWLH